MRWDYLLLWITAIGNLFKRQKDIIPITACLNCKEELEDDINFCPNCGQKKRYSKVTVWTLFAEFVTGILNIDNGAWRSLRYIIVPGFLAREFIEGRRKMYFNPVRFFLLALILHFSVITLVVDIDDINEGSTEQYKVIGQSELKEDFYRERDEVASKDGDTRWIDSLAEGLFYDLKMPDEDTLRADMDLGFVNLNDYPMLRKDVFEMNREELLEKYEVVDFWDRLAVSQYARAYKNLSGAVQFFIGNLIWGIVSTIFLLALLMKLLYIRRNRYYVEHLMVLFDIHTFCFILFTLALLVFDMNQGLAGETFAISGLMAFFYFYLTIKRYYEQGYFKSFIKFGMIGFSYFIIMFVMIALVFIASLLLYK